MAAGGALWLSAWTGAQEGDQLIEVGDVRHIDQIHRFVGEQRSRHARERGILGATDSNRPQKGIATADYQLIHVVMKSCGAPHCASKDESLADGAP